MKKKAITARKAGGLGPSELEAQIREAFAKQVGLRGETPYTRISTLVVATTKTVSRPARAQLESGVHGSSRLGAPIRVWDGEFVAQLIQDHYLEEFAQFAGLNLPEGLAKISQDDLSIGMAYMRAGFKKEAIHHLRQSLWLSAEELASAYLGTQKRAEMLRAAEIAIKYDRKHYNQFWIAGYGLFLEQRDERARACLEQAIDLLENDKTVRVQCGPGYQFRYLQALAMLIEISRRAGQEVSSRLRDEYERKQKLLAELGVDVGAVSLDGVQLGDDDIPAPVFK